MTDETTSSASVINSITRHQIPEHINEAAIKRHEIRQARQENTQNVVDTLLAARLREGKRVEGLEKARRTRKQASGGE